MKYTFIPFPRLIFIAGLVITLAGCGRELPPKYSFETLPLYNQLKDKLDLSRVQKIKGVEGALVYMVRYKEDDRKMYAASSGGNELLYANRMIDDNNGDIELTRNGESISIHFADGKETIEDLTLDTTLVLDTTLLIYSHGGTRFCQRQKGETFGACFKAEADEFCDSFVSCVALATQPAVSIVIGLACSCYA